MQPQNEYIAVKLSAIHYSTIKTRVQKNRNAAMRNFKYGDAQLRFFYLGCEENSSVCHHHHTNSGS
jgi:hypothetical protein